MTEVYRAKEVASFEARPLKRGIITEFDWEVRSLRDLKALSRSVHSQSVNIAGTGSRRGSPQARTSFVLWFEASGLTSSNSYTLDLSAIEGYIVSIKATLSCLHHSSSVEKQSNGRDMCNDGRTQLFTIDGGSPLGRAIQEHDGFVLSSRITPVSSAGMCVATIVESGWKVPPKPSLSEDLQRGWKSSDFFDVTLKSSEGEAFRAHRQLLAMRSPVFKAMFYGSMSEAQSGLACISASSAGLRHLLHFMYTDELDANGVEPNDAELFELAAQYEVPGLVALVREQLFRTLSVDNAVTHFSLAVQFSQEKLEESCKAMIKRNLNAVMRTEGWAQITRDPELMGTLLREGQKCHGENESIQRKPKRSRTR